jgi:subfamily B ATP-binding cassette protein MsbA|tara:strand:- start:967 stop:2763 length:1797 start_codon:yes stop_codon:yes gene_type:complete
LIKEAGEMHLPRKTVALLLSLHLLGTIMELSSLIILMPVFQFIQSGGDLVSLAGENKYWNWLIDAYSIIGLMPDLATLLVTSLVFLLLRQVFTYIRLLAQAFAKESMITRMRADAFENYLHADISYQDKAESGGLINDLTTDLQRAADYIFGEIMLAGLLIVSAIYLIGLFVLSVPMTFTAIAIFGLALLILRTQMKKSDVAGAAVVQANQRMSAFLIERLHLSRLVRLAGMERAESDQMRTLTTRQRDTLYRLFTLVARVDVVMEPMVIAAAYVLIFVSIEHFGLKIEHIGMFLVIVIRLLPMVKEIARTRQANRATKAAHHSITDRMQEMTRAKEVMTGEQSFIRLIKHFRFENVFFAYDKTNEIAALQGVSVSFPAGKLSAIVGPSGAGKSTLIDMIPRLRRPDKGQILLDDVSIDEFALDKLRSGISSAPQMPQIFNVSVAEHIRYGKADASMDEVKAAAELANAANFINELPNGYDTTLGESGVHLSGGQRQRIDLARALVRRAPILLLDEPTSNQDADSEALFREALLKIRAETDITIIVIAHRLSTVAMADKIVVLQSGAITSEGSHQKLLLEDGWYAQAFQKQKGADTRN